MVTVAGGVGLAAFTWLTVFQVALALGAPIGRLAWRGRHRVLPGRLRMASAASAGVTVLGAVTVGQAAGLGPDLLPAPVLRPLLIGFAALFGLSVIGNAVSDSRAERLHGVPVALAVVLSTAILAVAR